MTAPSVPTGEAPINAAELAQRILKIALDKKAFDPAIIEVGEAVGYADYFVIVSARSPRQTRAIAEVVKQTLKSELKLLPIGYEGQASGRWVLLDFDDVVLHVFHEGSRGFYDLDALFADEPHLEVPDAPGFTLDDDDDDDDQDDFDEEDDELPLFVQPDP